MPKNPLMPIGANPQHYRQTMEDSLVETKKNL